jgi:hypothetical protein
MELRLDYLQPHMETVIQVACAGRAALVGC